MTYNEWRDELKSNLLCVTESERRRVLDYYAEAYADRREAGFSEREIIEDFGAPYDAAQRILSDKSDDLYDDVSYDETHTELTRREKRRENREKRRAEQSAREESRNTYTPPPPAPEPAPVYTPPPPAAAVPSEDYTWVFVLLCIIFAAPLFGLIMTMVGITIGFCVAPIAVIGTGVALAGASIGSMIGGEVAQGFYMLGGGLITIGIGIALCPLFFKLVKLMWRLFNKFFSWLKAQFSGKKERV